MNDSPPSSTSEQAVRHAARVLLLDRDARVLLFRFVDPVDGSPFWITPGGGLDDGETYEDAARRELREETGLVKPEGLAAKGFGPCVWTRTIDIRYGHKRFRQHERYFPLRLDAAQPAIDTGGMLDYEVTDLHEHRWWSAEEIAASGDRFAPRRLAALLGALVNEPWPTSPVDVGQ